MSSPTPRSARPLREPLVLEPEPLMLSWRDDDGVRATLRRAGELTVIALGGALDATAVRPSRQALDAVLRSRPRRIVIDLAYVTSSDDRAVTMLVDLGRRAAWHGSELWLTAVPDHVQARLTRFGVADFFRIERSADRVADLLRRPDHAAPHRQSTLQHRTA